jgi:hypothetical protein
LPGGRIAGAILACLALAGAIYLFIQHDAMADAVDLRANLAELAVPFGIGVLLWWRGRFDRRFFKQVFGVLLANAGALGTMMLIVMIDEANGHITHFFSVPLLALPAVASPLALWCGLMLVFSKPRRPRSVRVRSWVTGVSIAGLRRHSPCFWCRAPQEVPPAISARPFRSRLSRSSGLDA